MKEWVRSICEMSATKMSGVLTMAMEARLGDDQADRLRLSIKTRAAD